MITSAITPFRIVLADDDEDDCFLISRALEAICGKNSLRAVHDGEELLRLLRIPEDTTSESPTLPHLILLDLNMPRMDGREALAALKSDPALCRIPTVVLTTSNFEQDVVRCYELGANSYLVKPKAYVQLVEVMQGLMVYWTDLVLLPDSDELGIGS